MYAVRSRIHPLLGPVGPVDEVIMVISITGVLHLVLYGGLQGAMYCVEVVIISALS
jgi:hypothetical protein